MRTANLKEMRLLVFMYLLCCSFTFNACISVDNRILVQVPYKLEVNPGEDAVFTCTTTLYNIKGANFRKRFDKILFVGEKFTKADVYGDRLLYLGSKLNFTVTLKNLTLNDSDIYLCDIFTLENNEIFSAGTLLIVRPPVVHEDKDTQQSFERNDFVHIPYLTIILVMFILFSALGIMYVKLKRSKELSLNHNTYVDMTQTIRRNTMGNSIIYTRTQNGAFST